jgi:hypothetical protein
LGSIKFFPFHIATLEGNVEITSSRNIQAVRLRSAKVNTAIPNEAYMHLEGDNYT